MQDCPFLPWKIQHKALLCIKNNRMWYATFSPADALHSLCFVMCMCGYYVSAYMHMCMHVCGGHRSMWGLPWSLSILSFKTKSFTILSIHWPASPRNPPVFSTSARCYWFAPSQLVRVPRSKLGLLCMHGCHHTKSRLSNEQGPLLTSLRTSQSSFCALVFR